MINYNSPIMAAINQQNQMQQPFIPQPIGNMVNMGMGYNQPMPPMQPMMPNGMRPMVPGMGAYYGGTGYNNPYLVQQR